MSDNNPFGGMFGDIFSLLGQQGPDAWFTTATQLALNIARGEEGQGRNREVIERDHDVIARSAQQLLDDVCQ